MFERFTERARQVVVLAQDEARFLGHNYIGTEHLLLGLLREEEGVASRVLGQLDITLEDARAQVAQIVGPRDEVVEASIPFTPRAKKVLQLALREALDLRHNYIGTEHILLGIARENEGVAARILLDFDADAEKIRSDVVRVLGGARAAAGPAPPETVPHSAQWEYHVVERADASEISVERLDLLGRDGWELAAAVGEPTAPTLVFKRQRRRR